MNGLVFFDTNVLIYADDSSQPAKQRCAVDLFSEHLRLQTAVISLQVLQEYFAVATRKLGLPADFAQHKVEVMSRARVVRFESSDVIAAIELHRLNQISFWDALIVHAARKAGAVILYTEDLSTGATIAGVRTINPFTPQPPNPQRSKLKPA